MELDDTKKLCHMPSRIILLFALYYRCTKLYVFQIAQVDQRAAYYY